MQTHALMLALTLLSLSTGTWSAESPKYQSETLLIPRVDTEQQVGMYQDAVLKLNSQGTWSLISLQTLGQGTLQGLLGIYEVDIVKTGENPVSVFVRMKGDDSFCGPIGPARIHQRRVGSRFDLHVTADRPGPNLQVACATLAKSYKITAELDVYGLRAGVYSYRVNGVIAGSFALDKDNKFADDCELEVAGRCR